MIFLRKIWPTVYRIINTIFLFLVSLIRTFVRLALRQIKDS